MEISITVKTNSQEMLFIVSDIKKKKKKKKNTVETLYFACCLFQTFDLPKNTPKIDAVYFEHCNWKSFL